MTRPTSFFLSFTVTTNFLTFVSAYASSEICNSRTVWQACLITVSRCVLHACISSFSFNTCVFSSYLCALLTFHSSRATMMHLSLIWNSSETPWCNVGGSGATMWPHWFPYPWSFRAWHDHPRYLFTGILLVREWPLSPWSIPLLEHAHSLDSGLLAPRSLAPRSPESY